MSLISAGSISLDSTFKRIVGPDPKCSGKVKGDVDTKRCGT
jgi:hypothetical protein